MCQAQAKQALQTIKQSVINARINECLDYLIGKIETRGKCVLNTEFKQLSAEYIN